MSSKPKKTLVDVRYVMQRCDVKESKAREVMREVGEIRLGSGKRSAVRCDPDDLESYLEENKNPPKGKNQWQKYTAAARRPTTTQTSKHRAVNASDARRIAEIKAKLLASPGNGNES